MLEGVLQGHEPGSLNPGSRSGSENPLAESGRPRAAGHGSPIHLADVAQLVEQLFRK